MLRPIFFLACLCALLSAFTAVSAVAQQQQRSDPQRSGQSPEVQRPVPAPRSAPGTTPVRRPRQSWYDYALKQINPNDLDYGSWIEERRQAFLDASVKNPYFDYSAITTIGLILMSGVFLKLWFDHRRTISITAEMMCDLQNHDAYSQRKAEEAIKRYNDHIEVCNRVIEMGGMKSLDRSTDLGSSEEEQLRAELLRTATERNTAIAERDSARSELEKKSILLASVSMRLDGPPKSAGKADEPARAVDSKNLDRVAMTTINTLQERLYAEEQKNKKIKGA